MPNPKLRFPEGLLVIATLAATPSIAAERDHLKGPVNARVLKITDGDSFKALAQVWPGMEISVSVRVRGIDAPELRGKCTAEKRLARAAQQRLEALLAAGEVRLANISGGKYYGRVIADVRLEDGRDIGSTMMMEGSAAAYGGKARHSWCG